MLGYLSPITEDELDEAAGRRGPVGQRCLGRSVAPASRSSTTAGCAACPATAASPSTRWAACSARTSEVAGQPGDTLVTSIDAKVQGVVEKQLADTITHRPADLRPGHRQELRRRLRRRRRDGGRHRPDRRDGQPADVRPGGLGRRASPTTQLPRLYSEEAGTPLLGRATQGQFAPGSTWKPFMTAGALNNGYATDTRLDCSSGFQVGNRRLQELRVRRLRLHRLRQGARGLLQHVLLPGRLRLLAALRLRRRRRRRQGPAGRGGQDVRLRQPRPASTCRARLRPDRRPAVEARLLRVDEGLLLRHGRQAAGRRDQRLRLHASPTSSASRATPTAPATP